MQKPVFGQTPTETQETTCAFLVRVEQGGCYKAIPCKEKPLVNGWCLRHQHAQQGLDLGAKLGFPSVSIPMGVYVGEEPFLLLLSPGEANWRAYFERAREPGLTTVMKYLEKLEGK